jgi:hypothetical protein
MQEAAAEGKDERERLKRRLPELLARRQSTPGSLAVLSHDLSSLSTHSTIWQIVGWMMMAVSQVAVANEDRQYLRAPKAHRGLEDLLHLPNSKQEHLATQGPTQEPAHPQVNRNKPPRWHQALATCMKLNEVRVLDIGQGEQGPQCKKTIARNRQMMKATTTTTMKMTRQKMMVKTITKTETYSPQLLGNSEVTP